MTVYYKVDTPNMNNVFMRISTSIIHQRFIWIQNTTSSTIIFLIWICWCAHINYVVHIVLNNNNNRNAQSALDYRCTHLRVQSVCKVRQKNLLHLLGIWGSCALLSILGFPHFKCHWAERERERDPTSRIIWFPTCGDKKATQSGPRTPLSCNAMNGENRPLQCFA